MITLKNSFYLILFSFLSSVFLIFLLLGIIKLEDKIQSEMIEISTADVKSIVQNSADLIQNTLSIDENFPKQILKNHAYHKKIETNLETLVTQNIKYAYLLYKDKRGVFRFLVDGAKKSNKAFVNQKFDIDNEKWIDVYKTKKPLIIENKFLKQISITYLVPILNKDKVQLLLVIDFSIKKVKEINKIITWIKSALIATLFILILFLLVLLIQSKRYNIVKKTAYIDKLTNVYNRNYLQEYESFINLDDYIIAAIDIDYFKLVNDTYGHDVGDKILKNIGRIILNSTRKKDDIVIRYGGEEFLILAKTKRNDSYTAINVIERVFTNIQKEKFQINENEDIDITVSVGVNLEPHKSKTFSKAFKLADIALYTAKNKGRNNIQIYNENISNDSNKLSINEIKEALEEKRVICHYQKIVDTKTQNTVKYEALLRIVKKDGTIAYPNEILSVINGTFILRNISKRVLNICFEKLISNKNILININLNPQDIVNDTILSMLEDMSIKYDDFANRLGIEITENEDLTNNKEAKINLLRLKKWGYKIYIDDFGSGYSNFTYLAQIKTDFIKIDGDLIEKILTDKISFMLVKSIIGFAKDAGIKVIAEYVSSEEIYFKLKELDVDYLQGFYFGKPCELEEQEI
ncbi:hypothetical protein CPU12_02710 [Malaciobacter molluscorum LMG 25693]|uniref:Diguanylate cyclase/phosphodiesterase n=1 Tax=Malaciobacter molluscorum LMG 25693 TaxID=870501 RepID=A0A2G1DKX5_9BACT|nr:bifunctional diguanylate cyclase/phosphodiesterase [Malaciobacter molluscorum]AXX92759.1 diguanylate cyclase/phosphodiesterase [Malaciobacter molluscorum LMG 25693]PHO19173.1 hypothetical protein CPU12_02710 [Malaciobacter molluscorum LMG 25693]